MSKNRKLLKKANLYLILDTSVLSYEKLLKQLKLAVENGVGIVQLRDKNSNAASLLQFSEQAKRIINHRALFIINDRVDLAMLAKADGVHVGQEDISYQQARHLMGRKAIIGVSCQTIEHVKKAHQDGADYIGFGSVFKTQTKPDRFPMKQELLRKVMKLSKLPTFAIGGINTKNAASLKDLGVKRIAVCRDILFAKDVKKTISEFKKVI